MELSTFLDIYTSLKKQVVPRGCVIHSLLLSFKAKEKAVYILLRLHTPSVVVFLWSQKRGDDRGRWMLALGTRPTRLGLSGAPAPTPLLDPPAPLNPKALSLNPMSRGHRILLEPVSNPPPPIPSPDPALIPQRVCGEDEDEVWACPSSV